MGRLQFLFGSIVLAHLLPSLGAAENGPSTTAGHRGPGTTPSPTTTTTVPPAPSSAEAAAAEADAAARAKRSTTMITTTLASTSTVTTIVNSLVFLPYDSKSPEGKSSAKLDPANTVLLNIAMCNTLTCPAGFESRPTAYKTMCASLRCSLDVDQATCCGQKTPWQTYMMAELACFCCLSMLCSFLGGLAHFYYPRRSSKRKKSAPKEDGTRESSARSFTLQAPEAVREDSASLPSFPALSAANSSFPLLTPAAPSHQPLVPTQMPQLGARPLFSSMVGIHGSQPQSFSGSVSGIRPGVVV